MSRPKLKLEYSFTDRLVEILCAGAIVSLFIMIIFYYNELPQLIPRHFNSAGDPNRYGDKSGILFFPISVLVIYLLMTFISRFPHIFNYAVEITPENAEVQYKNAVAMIRTVKLIISGIAFYITYTEIKIGLGESTGLGSHFLSVMLAILLGAITIFIYRSIRAR